MNHRKENRLLFCYLVEGGLGGCNGEGVSLKAEQGALSAALLTTLWGFFCSISVEV